MARIKLDSDTLKIMALFESVTGARLKDCIANEKILFIVQPNQSGLAIGREGNKIRKVEYLLKKKSVVKEYSENKIEFVKNLIGPIEVDAVQENDGVIEIKCKDNMSKSVLIGRDRHNLNFLLDVVKRHFDIKNIKIK